MKFTNIEIHNFLSVGDCNTHLNDRGLVLIQGSNKDSQAFDSNGAGKSTIFTEAPTWCIYGETIRGHKGDKVVKKQAKRDTYVKMTIEEGSDVYRIERYRKHREHKNSVLLFKNDKNITCSSDKLTNDKIIEILDMDYTTFTNSVVFGQGISKMFASATDSEQKAILEQMLQIDIFKKCQEKAKKGLSDISNNISDLSRDIEEYNRSIKTLEEDIVDLQDAELSEYEMAVEKIKKLKRDKAEYEKQLKVESNTDELTQSLKELVSLQGTIEEKISKFKEYEEELSEITARIKTVQYRISTKQEEITKNKKELQSILSNQKVERKCPTCGQNIPLEDTSQLQNHLLNAIADLHDEVTTLQENLDKDLNVKLEQVKKKLAKKEYLEKSLKEISQEVSSIREDISGREGQRKTLKTLISRINDDIQEQEEKKNTTYCDLIAQKTKKISDLGQLRDFHVEELSNKEKIKTSYEFWVNAYGNQGIKSMLLTDVVPFLNTRANHYLKQLSDSSIEVLFNTQTTLASGELRDKFCIEIVNENGDNDYKGSSGGEKKRIDIAINMALQDLVQSRSHKKVDMIVYDEVYEAIDDIGCEAVIQLLHEKANSTGTVLVITHNPELKDLFTDSIVVNKSGGKTTLTEKSI